jgi:hypothetical protein
MNPIIMPIPYERLPNWEEQVRDAALEYSSEINQQSAFISGAKWQRDPGPSGLMVLLVIFLIIFSIIQISSFCMGITEHHYKEESSGKWGYVVPLYKVGQYFGSWMEE